MYKTPYLLLVCILISLACVSRFSIDIYLPSLPHMLVEFHTNRSTLQLTLTVFILGYAFSALIWGIVSDRIGTKPTALIGMYLYIAATCLCLLSSSIYMLIIGRFFQALGGGSGPVLARLIAKNIFPKSQYIQIMTYLSTAVAISPVIAPMFGGFLEKIAGWHASFFSLLIIAILNAICVFLFVTDPKTESVTKVKHDLLASYKQIIYSRLFIAYATAISLAASILFSFISLSPFIFHTSFGVGPIEFGFLFALSTTGFIIGTSIARQWIKFFSLNKIIIAGGFLCFVTSSFMLIYAELGHLSPITTVIFITIVMVGIGMIMPMCQIGVMDLFPTINGTATGLFFFLQMCTNVITGVVLSFMESTLFSMSCLMVIVSFLLCILFYINVKFPQLNRSIL